MSDEDRLAALEARVRSLEHKVTVLGPLAERPVRLDAVVVDQFLERLSMIEHQLGQITDHLGFTPPPAE